MYAQLLLEELQGWGASDDEADGGAEDSGDGASASDSGDYTDAPDTDDPESDGGSSDDDDGGEGAGGEEGSSGSADSQGAEWQAVAQVLQAGGSGEGSGGAAPAAGSHGAGGGAPAALPPAEEAWVAEGEYEWWYPAVSGEAPGARGYHSAAASEDGRKVRCTGRGVAGERWPRCGRPPPANQSLAAAAGWGCPPYSATCCLLAALGLCCTQLSG
jgi:hypothetical protein